MSRLHKSITMAAGALALVFAAGTQAETVNVQTLSLDQISGTFMLYLNSYQISMQIDPPKVLNMGGYAGNLLSYDNGTYQLSLDSTDAYGGGPLSGSVDTSTSSISLDLSSLYASLVIPSVGISASDAIWTPLSNVTQHSYDSSTSEFSYGWSGTIYASLPTGGAVPINYNLLFHGTADISSVPVPAAAWLFGSGLLSLIGVARRKKI